MKKIFLTSGLVLCLACPAMAATDIQYTPQNGDTPASWDPATDANNCVNTYLGTYSGSATFEPIWQNNTYSITYATDEMGTSTNPLTVDGIVFAQTDYTILGEGTGTGASGITSNTGYHFVQWVGTSTNATNYNGANYQPTDVINDYPIDGDLTLTAQHTHNVNTITLNSTITNGDHSYTGENNDGLTATTSPIYSAYNIGFYDAKSSAIAGQTGSGSGIISGVTKPSKHGYTFGGFYDDTPATAVQVIDDNGDFVSGSDTYFTANDGTATLNAHWTANNHTITFTCGSKPTTAGSTATFDVNGAAPTIQDGITYDSAFSLPTDAGTCALSGYHFVGWSCNYALTDETDTLLTIDKDGAYADHTIQYPLVTTGGTSTITGGTGTVKVDKAVTCDAIWAPNEIGLTWYKDVAGTTNANVAATGGGANCNYDGGITLPANPEKTGYTFKGWHVRSTSSN